MDFKKKIAELRALGDDITVAQLNELLKLLKKDSNEDQKGALKFIEFKQIDEEKKEITVIASSDSEDRMGDIIDQAGMQIDNFKKNPVLLADHDYRIEKVLGKVVDISKEKSGKKTVTKMRMSFATEESELADFAFRMMKSGFINAVSIGFRPTKTEFKEIEGKNVRIFKEWELLELSVVAVPANPDAVQNAFKKGITDEKELEKIENELKGKKPEKVKMTMTEKAAHILVENHEITKKYRKAFELIRKTLGVDPLDDETETIDSTLGVFKSIFPAEIKADLTPDIPLATPTDTKHSARPANQCDIEEIIALTKAGIS